jgi:cytosine/adenosine deaminase-related metal-dependent hydrolase
MNDLLREQRNGQIVRGKKIGGYLGMLNTSRRTSRPSFYKMLELATIGGAKALGLDKDVGSLEVEKKADLITFNLMNPYIKPTRDPITSIFLYGTPGDIDNVICDGKFLKKDNKLTTIDLNKALSKAQKTCDEIINKFFAEHPEQKKIWKEKAKQNISH